MDPTEQRIRYELDGIDFYGANSAIANLHFHFPPASGDIPIEWGIRVPINPALGDRSALMREILTSARRDLVRAIAAIDQNSECVP